MVITHPAVCMADNRIISFPHSLFCTTRPLSLCSQSKNYQTQTRSCLCSCTSWNLSNPECCLAGRAVAKGWYQVHPHHRCQQGNADLDGSSGEENEHGIQMKKSLPLIAHLILCWLPTYVSSRGGRPQPLVCPTSAYSAMTGLDKRYEKNAEVMVFLGSQEAERGLKDEKLLLWPEPWASTHFVTSMCWSPCPFPMGCWYCTGRTSTLPWVRYRTKIFSLC